jgi:hypothetical protein
MGAVGHLFGYTNPSLRFMYLKKPLSRYFLPHDIIFFYEEIAGLVHGALRHQACYRNLHTHMKSRLYTSPFIVFRETSNVSK